MNTSTIETKFASVAEFAAMATTKQDKDKLEIIYSHKDAVPEIMNCQVIRYEFIIMDETFFLYKLIPN